MKEKVARKGATVYGTDTIVTAGFVAGDAVATLQPDSTFPKGTRLHKTAGKLRKDPDWESLPGTQ